MIYCEKEQLSRYLGMDAALDTALRRAAGMDGHTLAMGRNEVDGDSVFINRFDYRTMPEDGLLYESHAVYADIHLLLSGEEDILVAPEHALDEKERDEHADYIGLQGPWEARFHMAPGKALIVFPREAHKVKCQIKEAGAVQKIVFKVKMGSGRARG